ncbi:NADase-type glycan-binding domain-containing protein [Oceaniglobus trochenteri]|uniref:NADase-type glycan-binding domain-containing protein n=1 Tax=Oceaniglobus trochenteri TaxID=2763260 RepID=UPI001D00147E|nr:hypothetical protein [Oceaniglobus trochenteri]
MYRTALFCLTLAACPAFAQGQSGISRGPETRSPGIAAPSAPGIAGPGPATTARDMPNRPGERCARVQTNAGSAMACASSTLPTSAAASYGVENMFDGRPETGWVEGVEGTGANEFVTIRFDRPVRLGQLALRNGYGKSARLWDRNGRVEQIRLEFSTGADLAIALQDSADWQAISLADGGPVEWLAIHILRARSGSAYTDTVISEIDLR